MKTLNVWWDDQLVGVLSQDVGKLLGFKYDNSWLENKNSNALSISLPKRKKEFSTNECKPFFAGLLPEQRQKSILARNLRVSVHNDFSFLEKLGEDVAGILQILPPNKSPTAVIKEIQTKPLTTEELTTKIDDLPKRPLLFGDSELRVSLAGAQSKVPVILVENKIGLPIGGQPTTHILKPSMNEYPSSTENEAFVMRLAKSIGLDVADVEPMSVKGRKFLLVTRYDRIADNNSITKRLHQEDFCQALGIAPEHKYDKRKKPDLLKCFTLLRNKSITPAIDIEKFLKAVIFNVVVGNADAHGKNFSLLYNNNGPYLAPLYDLLSTVIYPELTQNFAMNIGRCKTLEELQQRGWERFATNIELGLPYLRDHLFEVCNSIESKLNEVSRNLNRPELDKDTISFLESTIKKRANLCMKTI